MNGDDAYLPAAKKPRLVILADDVDGTPGPKDLFASIPDELMLKILSHLSPTFLASVVALVNKRLNELSKDVSLWIDLSLNPPVSVDGPEDDGRRDALLRVLEADGMQRMERLSMGAAWRHAAASVAIRALAKCPKLSALCLVTCGGTAGSLGSSLSLTVSNVLTTLVIAGEWDPRSVDWRLMDKLTRLEVDTRSGVDSESLGQIGEHCVRLVRFSCRQATDPDDVAVAALLTGLGDALVSLELDGLGRKLGPLSVRALGRCRALERLDLHEVIAHLGRSGLEILASGLPRLAHFFVTCADTCAKNRHLRAALRVWPRLTFLDLSGFAPGGTGGVDVVDDRTLRVVAARCSELVYLDVSNCVKITDAGVKIVLRRCAWLSRLGLLRVDKVTPEAFRVTPPDASAGLRLSLLAVDRNGSVWSDAALEEIGRMWPELAVYDGLLSDVMYRSEVFLRDHFYPGQTDEESGRPWRVQQQQQQQQPSPRFEEI